MLTILLLFQSHFVHFLVEAFLHEFAGNIDILGPQATFMSEVAAIFGHTLFIL